MAAVRTKNEKARLLYLIRHGEGIHNVAEREFGKEHWESVEALTEKYFDAPLNDVGERQCAELQSSFQKATEGGMPPVDTIIVSPLTRAIETAKLGLAHIWGKVPTYAVDLCRERYGKNLCDKRKSVTELKKLHPEINFDLFMDSQEDEAFTPVRETDEAIEQRIAAFYNWLTHHTPTAWGTVAVVGHSSFMAHSVQWLQAPYHWPSNCECVSLAVQPTLP
mmetsp:Transcript_16094/g.29428  ORF Transcript_16094/g.29428 Transcript_16094/m.29428 type:complete len:221 (+) Transcript_16094:712-1374(+)